MKVLFVGNGFDRKIGLKTDYISFLDWMKKEGYGVGEIFRLKSKKIFFSESGENKGRLNIFQEKMKGSSSYFYSGEVFCPQEGRYISRENNLENNLLYLLPTLLNDKASLYKKEEPNIWYCFLQLLRIEKLNKFFNLNLSKFENYINDDGSWVDVEGIILANIRGRIEHDIIALFSTQLLEVSQFFDIVSLTKFLYFDNIEPNKLYQIIWNDFLEFKETLCTYLKEISLSEYESKFNDCVNQLWGNGEFNKPLKASNYELIVNFNFTVFLTNKLNIYNVHGNITDGKNVVFGLDPNIDGKRSEYTNITQFELDLNKNKPLLKFSKISQLLTLQAEKESYQFKTINELTILGHSIGQQDYSYYFSILDRNVDDIIINCLWYEFNEGGNNKEFMKEALFEMLTHYERYSNKRVLHKMIFEGRIKLKEIHIPKIF